MPGRKPNKKELAQMKVMSDLGHSPSAIAEKLGRSHHTVIKYLNSDVYNDPTIGLIVEKIRETEINDLYLLGAKARKNLHTLLDEGKMKAIENIAAMDRTFQQRRLLEGKTTENIGSITRLINESHEESIREARERSAKRKEEPEPVTGFALSKSDLKSATK